MGKNNRRKDEGLRGNREMWEKGRERIGELGEGKWDAIVIPIIPHFSNSSNLFIGLQLHRLTTITENTTNATNKETHDMYYYYILGGSLGLWQFVKLNPEPIQSQSKTKPIEPYPTK